MAYTVTIGDTVYEMPKKAECPNCGSSLVKHDLWNCGDCEKVFSREDVADEVYEYSKV